MRSKEEANDYRYFPEPDLAPFILDESQIKEIKETLPQLPAQRQKCFVTDYNISDYDAKVLTQDKALADYFQECAKDFHKPKLIANWLLSDIAAIMNTR